MSKHVRPAPGPGFTHGRVSAPAPLLDLPIAPIPAGARAEWFEGAGGLRLRAALFPAETPRGTVVLSGGRTEFIEKYLEVITELVGRGFTVLTHDWRGQGLSGRLLPDRLKGHAAGFGDFVADFGLLLDRYEGAAPKPWIALSHSMGGCVAMTALARGESRFSGAMFSSPMLGLKAQRSVAARAFVRGARLLGLTTAYVPPGARDPFTATFQDDRLIHDEQRYDRTRAMILANPDLALGAVTFGWVDSAFETLRWLRGADYSGVAIPVLILGAGEENLVDNAGQALITGRSRGCRYEVSPGAFHELLMERDAIRAVVWREFDALAASISPSA